MKVKQLISILLMLLLLTACSANTDLDLPDEAGSSEQTSNMDASAAEPEDGAEKPTLPEIETPEGAPDAELVETLLVTVVDNINGENTDDGVELVIYAYDEQSQAFRVIFKTPIGPYVYIRPIRWILNTRSSTTRLHARTRHMTTYIRVI